MTVDIPVTQLLTCTCVRCDQDFQYRSTTGGRQRYCNRCRGAIDLEKRKQTHISVIRTRQAEGAYVVTPSGMVGIIVGDNTKAIITVRLETGNIVRYETRSGSCES